MGVASGRLRCAAGVRAGVGRYIARPSRDAAQAGVSVGRRPWKYGQSAAPGVGLFRIARIRIGNGIGVPERQPDRPIAS